MPIQEMEVASSSPIPQIGEQEYYDLGPFHRPVTTTSPISQTWFDRGLTWTYGFHHSEAISCFSRALASDSTCVMACWGLAYALGPNYNKPWEVFDSDDFDRSLRRIWEALAHAKGILDAEAKAKGEGKGKARLVERALVEVLAFRYPSPEVELGALLSTQTTNDFNKWNQAYATAMKTVYDSFPEDLDVVALYADSLMNLTPWKLWDIRTGLPSPKAHTLEIKRILELSFRSPEERGENALKHPGLLHLYIHLMEMSSSPSSALPIANHLRDLVPSSGHLLHMPSHLDILCGDYASAISSNQAAIFADDNFTSSKSKSKSKTDDEEIGMDFYTLYKCHNFHFLIYAAMFSGQLKIAMKGVDGLENLLNGEDGSSLLSNGGKMADWLEAFYSIRIHVLIRFGLWESLLSLPIPSDTKLYCVTTAMMHYGKGVAFAALGKISDAERERVFFGDAVGRVLKSRWLFNNPCRDILGVAEAMLDGEIAYRKAASNTASEGEFEVAWMELRKAIERDDGLAYDEPWGWMQPARHAYGALLLEQGELERAEAVYSADLGIGRFKEMLPRARRHPKNVWALHGYVECLRRLGRDGEGGRDEDGNEDEAVKDMLRGAVERADVEINGSCFCRVGGK